MKRLVFLFVLSVTAAVLLNSCGTRPGKTQLEVGEMQRDSKSVDPRTPGLPAPSSRSALANEAPGSVADPGIRRGRCRPWLTPKAAPPT